MWSFGTQAMNTAMKNNRALLRKRHSFIEHRKNYLNTKLKYAEIAGEDFDFKVASEEELAKIRKKFIYERKKSALINILLFVVIISICSFSIYKLYLSDVNSVKPISNEIPNNIKKEFNLILKDADEWMEVGNFENAIFQYTRASKLIPNQFDVEYRICLSYSYLCRYDQLECEKGKEVLSETIAKFPDENSLKELTIYF